MLLARIKAIAQNPHTSGAALALLAAYFLIPVLAAWFPGHEAQFQKTAEAVKGFAYAYGLIFAADSKPEKPQNGNAGSDNPAQQQSK